MSHKIHSDAEMEVNLELIQGMYRAIAELHRRIAPQNFTNYLILAEGPIDQIRLLKAEIDDYLGIKESMEEPLEDAPQAMPAPGEHAPLDSPTISSR